MTGIFFAFLGLLFFSAFFWQEDKRKEKTEPLFFCGVIGPERTPAFEAGKVLFKQNCASCHNKNMRDNLAGPALKGTAQRWANYPEQDLYNWIRNSQKMITDGHPRAQVLWMEWSPTVMTAFPRLTDEDIANILGYIKGMSEY
ncbi:MAG: cytochrome c [Bacteroidota bacterium]